MNIKSALFEQTFLHDRIIETVGSSVIKEHRRFHLFKTYINHYRMPLSRTDCRMVFIVLVPALVVGCNDFFNFFLGVTALGHKILNGSPTVFREIIIGIVTQKECKLSSCILIILHFKLFLHLSNFLYFVFCPKISLWSWSMQFARN